jgi:carbamoylphosphate synthase large subunit
VDKPYISDFFKETVREHAIPIVDTEISRQLGMLPGTNLLSEAEAIKSIEESQNCQVYTTSENALAWIVQNLPNCDLVRDIELFKNKVSFRELLQPLMPDFYFQEVSLADLAELPYPAVDHPLIIKPATGFMSEGVYKVIDQTEWNQTKNTILERGQQAQELYPREVVDLGTFIIEQCIQGEEYAVDVFFNDRGKAVVLNILEHTFSSIEDVSDRVYTTSAEIMTSDLEEFTQFANDIGQLAGVRNFPAHIELRRDPSGSLIPIEINPVRFGGWCTTADLAHHAYGFNPYVYFYLGKEPDWTELLKEKSGKLYSIIILDNSTGVDPVNILEFDYQKLLAGFENPLELRRFDYREYPIFGFLFTETSSDNKAELDRILVSDLREFITIRD